MFYKKFLMEHLKIIIKTDDKKAFKMLSQYPMQVHENNQTKINIIVHKDSLDAISTNGYNEIKHSFNVSSEIKIKQFCNDKSDLIFRTTELSKLCICRDFEKNCITCNYAGEIDDCRNFICAVVEIFVTNIIYTLDFLPLHGAVIAKDDLCIALCGTSGSGKSSTVLQLLTQDAQLLSNDLFYLDTKSGDVYSLDKTFGVRETSFAPVKKQCENIKKIAPYIYSTDQYYYDMQEYLKERFITKAKLNAIFIVKISDSAELRISGGNNILKNVLKSCIFPSTCINKTINFLDCYRNIQYNCFLGQIELPNFKGLPIEYDEPLITWRAIYEFFEYMK